MVRGKLQVRERSTRFQLAMALYSTTSTLAVSELEVKRYGKVQKLSEPLCKSSTKVHQLTSNTEAFALKGTTRSKCVPFSR